jgi:hypothetical protein
MVTTYRHEHKRHAKSSVFGVAFDDLSSDGASPCFETSNLPPSKEVGEGDCGCANPTGPCQQKEVSPGRQPPIGTFLAAATTEIEGCRHRISGNIQKILNILAIFTNFY